MTTIPGVKVFLANVSDQMQTYRENLIKELEHYGCSVKQLDQSDQDIEKTRELIEQCEVAIHILSDHDYAFDSNGKGFEESQVHCSVQYYLSQQLIVEPTDHNFKVYAWYPKSYGQGSEEAQIPDHLKKIQRLEEVELLRTNFEDFKFYLMNKIENDFEEEIDKFYIKGNDRLSVYFLYDRLDQKKANEYISYLENRGYTVLTPKFDSDIVAVRQMHTNSLLKFDLAIIFADEASLNWINMKILDILKSPGLGRVKEILGKALFITGKAVNSLPPIGRGFEVISTDHNEPKDHIEEFLKKVAL